MTKAMISGRSPVDAHGRQDHLHADQLQGDVRHGGQDAGERDGQRQQAAVVAAADEVGAGDVVVAAAHRPQARHDHEDERVDDDRVRQREHADRAGAEDQRRHGDEGVGGVQVAAEQEPGDDRAEASAGQAPLVQQIEVAARQRAAKKPSTVTKMNSTMKTLRRRPSRHARTRRFAGILGSRVAKYTTAVMTAEMSTHRNWYQ